MLCKECEIFCFPEVKAVSSLSTSDPSRIVTVNSKPATDVTPPQRVLPQSPCTGISDVSEIWYGIVEFNIPLDTV